MADKTDVLQFMVIRAPEAPAPAAALSGYVHDDVLTIEGRRDADLFSTQSEFEPQGQRNARADVLPSHLAGGSRLAGIDCPPAHRPAEAVGGAGFLRSTGRP
jgi:hypothetical protein